MKRAWIIGCVLGLPLLLAGSAGWTEGEEAVVSQDLSVPILAPQTTNPPVPSTPTKRRFSITKFLAKAIQPMFRHPQALSKLIPSRKYLPPHLRDREHDDYLIPGLTLMPRAWTTFDWGRPRMIVGNQERFLGDAPKPIGERGSFQLSVYPDLPPPLCWLPAYLAFTLPNGVHFRLGARWDDIDSYVVVPSVAIKKKVE